MKTISKLLLTFTLVYTLNFINSANAAPLIALNSHGHDVVILQKTLIKLNYKVENSKGFFDYSTQEALKAFQKDHNLTITGKVDRATWQIIKANTPWQGNKGNQASQLEPAKPEVLKPQVTPEDPKPKKPVSPLPQIVPQRKQIQPIHKTKPAKKAKQGKQTHKKKIKKVNSSHAISTPLIKNVSSVPMGKEIITANEAEKIIRTAKKFIGTPYVFGGDTPDGFDCSGYLEYVFGLHHMKIPRTADVQYKLGKDYPLSKLKPGDLVFFSTYEAGVSHCGIYLGDKKFIHASTSRGVIIDNMDSDYWAPRFYGGKKIVK